jgi:hypothetical protein
VPAAHALPATQLLLSSAAESPVCVHHEFEDRNVEQRKVSLSALSADYGLNVVTAVVAAATATHPGAAPPASVHSLQSKCPAVADPECSELNEHGLTPPTGSSSSSARRPLYPSSCRLQSIKETVDDYRMARYEKKHDMYLKVRSP